MAEPVKATIRGVVKSIMSGDCVVIRGRPTNGPPPERILALAGITAPRLGRRPQTGDAKEELDEPWAWESREYLRRKLVGKQVSFTVDYAVPSGREFGTIILDAGTARQENVTQSIIRDGMAKCREGAREGDIETLKALEASAQAAGKGVWSSDVAKHVRKVTWNVPDMRAFVDKHANKPLDAVIEYVRDGCTVRAFLLPSLEYVTVMLTGIKTPTSKRGADDKLTPEPFSAEARYYTESRLLQREVKIVLEGTSGNNFMGTVLHPKAGNIAEYLLVDGFAKVVDWSLASVTSGREKYRAAEAVAKAKRLRVWKDYTPSAASAIPDGERSYTAVVEEVVNAETLVVRPTAGGDEGPSKKVHLASVRQPRVQQQPATTSKPAAAADSSGEADAAAATGPAKRRGGGGNRMWDTPMAFEAREFLRKKLVGKAVSVFTDYVKEANEGYPAKSCVTVKVGDINIAEALISRGLASCLRHRQDDDNRSASYDDLMSAETRAKKSQKGIHASKPSPPPRVTQVTNKELGERFYPSFERAGRVSGVVEHVMNGARMRVYVPKESAVVTVCLPGLSCPRTGRGDQPDDVGAREALSFTRRRCLQREVDLRVEGIDRSGCMVGHLFVNNEPLAEALVSAGLSKLHFTADRYSNYSSISSLEASAKAARKGLWAEFVEPSPEELAAASARADPENVKDRKTAYSNVIVSYVSPDMTVHVQPAESSEALTAFMGALAKATAAGTTPAAEVKKGAIVAAQFVDGAWYRARVDRTAADGEVEITYVDYGNSETTTKDKLAALPSDLPQLEPQATSCKVALISPPPEDYLDESVALLAELCLDKQVQYNVEYTDGGDVFASFMSEDGEADLGRELIYSGYAVSAKRREPAFRSVLKEYKAAETDAKKSRVGMWQYGDSTADDARDWGMGNKTPAPAAKK